MIKRALRLPAPAKLNLMLRIVGRRPDGYHLLQTVFQFIDYCDWLTFHPRDDGLVTLKTPLPGVPEHEDLTIRAAKALKAKSGVEQGVTIEIEKNLPMGGGIGGGSSDAATTLMGLNALWGAGLSLDELKEMGLSLGADVPIFIDGHASWAEGVGEHLEHLDLEEPWYLVLVPPCHVPTGAIFSSPNLTRDNPPIKMCDFLAGQHDNHCLPVVEVLYPQIRTALNDLSKYSPARLTGTGACVFAAFNSESEALRAAEDLQISWRLFVSRGLNVSPLHTILAQQQ